MSNPSEAIAQKFPQLSQELERLEGITEFTNNSEREKHQQEVEIVIDPEFQALIPPLSDEERTQLKANLLREGCRDPLVVWKGQNILLDGHNRYSICTKLGIEFTTVEIEVRDREEAIAWIIENQLGRRNLTPEAISYLRGKHYNQQKQQGKRTDLTSYQDDTKLNSEAQSGDKLDDVTSRHFGEKLDSGQSGDKLSGTLAKTYKVGARTIERDAQFAQAVDKLAEVVGEDIRPAILTRNAKVSKTEVLKLAKTVNRNPDTVRERFGQPVVKQPKHYSPLPFRLGEVCRIVSSDEPQLKGKLGYWCIITAVHNFTCDLEFWNGTATLIKPEYLESLNFTEQQCLERKSLCTRLKHLSLRNPEFIAYRMLLELGRKREPELTPLEMKLLDFIASVLDS